MMIYSVVKCPYCGRYQATSAKVLQCKFCRRTRKIMGKKGVTIAARCENPMEAAVLVQQLNSRKPT